MSVPVIIIIDPPRRNTLNAPALPASVYVQVGTEVFPPASESADYICGVIDRAAQGIAEMTDPPVALVGMNPGIDERDALAAYTAASEQYAEEHPGD